MPELFYPCVMDWDANTVSKRAGPAMSHSDAVSYLKQHYSGAWERGVAYPQPVSHELFANPDED